MFQPTKCCALHEWRLRRAAPQHREVAVKGGFGPFMPIDTKGGELLFAAIGTKVSFAQLVNSAKL
jgi:hypothetical protein